MGSNSKWRGLPVWRPDTDAAKPARRRPRPSVAELVRSKESVVCWLVPRGSSWFGLAYFPGAPELQIMVGMTKPEITRLLKEVKKEMQIPLRIVEGTDGIAALDPEWEGERLVLCSDPACTKLHDVDELVADSFVRRTIN